MMRQNPETDTWKSSLGGIVFVLWGANLGITEGANLVTKVKICSTVGTVCWRYCPRKMIRQEGDIFFTTRLLRHGQR